MSTREALCAAMIEGLPPWDYMDCRHLTHGVIPGHHEANCFENCLHLYPSYSGMSHIRYDDYPQYWNHLISLITPAVRILCRVMVANDGAP